MDFYILNKFIQIIPGDNETNETKTLKPRDVKLISLSKSTINVRKLMKNSYVTTDPG